MQQRHFIPALINSLILALVFGPVSAHAGSVSTARNLGTSTTQSRQQLLNTLRNFGDRAPQSFSNAFTGQPVQPQTTDSVTNPTTLQAPQLPSLDLLDFTGAKTPSTVPPSSNLPPLTIAPASGTSAAAGVDDEIQQVVSDPFKVSKTRRPPSTPLPPKAPMTPLPPDKTKSPPKNITGEGAQGGSQVLPRWKPLCFLIEPNYKDPNKLIKGVVDTYASCGVVAEVFPFTVKNMPWGPDETNEAARTVCNLAETFGVAETSIQTLHKNPLADDEMCGEPPGKDGGTAGCAEFAPPRTGGFSKSDTDKLNEKLKAGGGGHFGGAGKSGGKDLVSILSPGQGTSTSVHEFQHNNGGVNVGEGDPKKPHGDYGIESVKKDGSAHNGHGGLGNMASGGGSGATMTAEGCAHLVGASNKNDGTHAYTPSREIYYKKIEDPQYQYDMAGGRSFFEGAGGGLPPPPAHPPRGIQGDLAFDPPAKATLPPPGKSSGHQRPPKGGSTSAGKVSSPELDSGFFGKNEDELFGKSEDVFAETDVPLKTKVAGAPPAGKGKGSNKLFFDDEEPAEKKKDGESKGKKGSGSSTATLGGTSVGGTSIGGAGTQSGTDVSGTSLREPASAGGAAGAEGDGLETTEASLDGGFFSGGLGSWLKDDDEDADTEGMDGDFWAKKAPKAKPKATDRKVRAVK